MKTTKRRVRINFGLSLILLWIMICLAVPAGLLFIFLHFVMKYW